MKTNLQIGFAVLLLMGIVLGASFISQYTKPAERITLPIDDPKNLGDAPPKLLLKFDRQVSDWRKDIAMALSAEDDALKFIRPVEMGQKYSYVFWVRNPQDEPVTMAVKSISCNCTDMECAVFSPAAWAAFQRQSALAATVNRLVSFNPLSPAGIVALLESAKWNKMPFVTPEPGAPEPPPAELLPAKKGGPPGMVRANFQPKHMSGSASGETVKVTVTGRMPGEPACDIELLVKFATVPELGVLASTLDMGDISSGGKSSRDLLIWSITRGSFEPELKLLALDGSEIDDPCFEFGKPEELPPEHIAGLSIMLKEKAKIVHQPSARKMAVTVYEQRGGHRLDIGPFQRTVLLRTPNSVDAMRLTITAIVRGEVRLFGGDDHDRIALGNFHRGVKKTVNLESDQGIDLEVDTKATSSLFKSVLTKEQTTANGKNRWQLLIEIPDDSIAGDLVPGTAVVLQLKGSPRKMRIPVTGTAAR